MDPKFLPAVLMQTVRRAFDLPRALHPYLSLNRLLFAGITLAGLGASVLCLRKSWFEVPVASIDGARSPNDIVNHIPACTIWFQATMAVLLILLVATWVHRRRWTLLSTFIATAMCVVPLTFPYFVMVRSPAISAEASWLQSQHDNLTWLGGDIYAAAEYGSRGWKSKSYLIDPPKQLAVMELPSWSPSEVGLHRCGDLMSWLGYTNTFCQFVGRGWAMAIVGAVMLFLATLQRDGKLVFDRIGFSLAIFTASAVVAALVGWAFPFKASRQIRLAAIHCSRGDDATALKHLQRAIELVPVLSQDTYYVAQRGVLDQNLGVESDYALLRDAIALESASKFEQAYRSLLPLIDSNVPAVRREALRGVIRFAIQDYNSGRFELSRKRFSLVLCRQPCDVKLIYMIQLQAIRESRHDVVCEMRDWMYSVCEHLNFGTVKILRAVAQQHVAVSAGLEGDAMAIWLAQREAKRP